MNWTLYTVLLTVYTLLSIIYIVYLEGKTLYCITLQETPILKLRGKQFELYDLHGTLCSVHITETNLHCTLYCEHFVFYTLQ